MEALRLQDFRRGDRVTFIWDGDLTLGEVVQAHKGEVEISHGDPFSKAGIQHTWINPAATSDLHEQP